MSRDRDPERTKPTEEVGSEGGSPGDVELGRKDITTGSERTSTVSARVTREDERRHDETGEGRRTP